MKRKDSRLRLRLFGCWQMSVDHRTVDMPLRARRIIALLALRGRLPRSYAAATLWPDTDEQRSQTSLRAVLSDVQRRMPGIVHASNGDLELSAEVSVDVHEFRADAATVLRGERPDLSGVDDLAAVAGGELLPGWYDEWVLVDRERLHHLKLHVTEALSDRLMKDGFFPQALEMAFRAVELDPLRESARRAVIQVYLAEGNPASAVREYRRFRATLREELGVEPTYQLSELVERGSQSSWPVEPGRQPVPDRTYLPTA
ncbi:SARP family transcriptional regulator [Phytoactinopolyspora halophila]|uniref:SARP family transcriptional regulator n=2 Tax=Phytoactinopolyspora halophila TaxID=1981511 RepID=A0A329QF43_9ACTN|nr:SARP family transcriptional regulator [Phytoactinopolyspora halophila]